MHRQGSILSRTRPDEPLGAQRLPWDEPLGVLAAERPDYEPQGELQEPVRAVSSSKRPLPLPPSRWRAPSEAGASASASAGAGAPIGLRLARVPINDWIDAESIDSLDGARASTFVEDSLDDAASVSSAAFASAHSSASTAAVDDEAATLTGAELFASFARLREQAEAGGSAGKQAAAMEVWGPASGLQSGDARAGARLQGR